MKDTQQLINVLVASHLFAIWLLVSTQLLYDRLYDRSDRLSRVCRPANRFLIVAGLFWAIVLLSFLAQAEAKAGDTSDNTPVVEVFTDRAHPLIHAEALPGAIIYRIDGLIAMQERLSEGLPADEMAATRIAKQRISTIDKDAVTESAQGLVLAHLKYQLDRYPAIVFAGQAVIYGVTDLALAKRLYDESRTEAP